MYNLVFRFCNGHNADTECTKGVINWSINRIFLTIIVTLVFQLKHRILRLKKYVFLIVSR